MSMNCNKLYEFGPYSLNSQKRVLWRAGETVPLTAKAAEILTLLVDRSGEVVSKQELMEALWPDSYVEEANLTQNVFLLRKALGETAQDRNYILTVPGRGYRFAAAITEVRAGADGAQPGGASEAASGEISAGATRAPVAEGRNWPWRVAAVLVLVMVSTYVGWRWLHPPRQGATRRVVLAVLPFANLTGEASQDYFIDGLTAEMIVQLGRLDPRRLGVISRTSVMSYKEGQNQVERVARELGVDYVLEGSVRRDSDKLRITAELIQVRDQTHLWAQDYDRQLAGPFALQGEIAREVADEVQVTLGDHADIKRKPEVGAAPEATEAHDLYLRGLYFWNKRTVPGFQHAVDYFQQAIAKDPHYARAYAGLADCYLLMSSYNIAAPEELAPKARAAALRSLEIDDKLPEGHTALALIAEYDWDWRTAEKEFRRAIELDPDYATAHHWYAESLAFQGRFDEALAESERARQLDPLSLIIATDNAAIRYYAGQYDRAIEQLRAVLDMEPNFPRAHALLIGSYVEKGLFAKALAEIQSSRRIDAAPWKWAEEAFVYGRMGQRVQARHALQKFEEAIRHQYWNSAPMFSALYAGMGERDEALAWLEKAYSERSPALGGLKVDHAYDPLRGDPRFQGLMRRIGLAQ